jgi:hypothetical protein
VTFGNPFLATPVENAYIAMTEDLQKPEEPRSNGGVVAISDRGGIVGNARTRKQPFHNDWIKIGALIGQ